MTNLVDTFADLTLETAHKAAMQQYRSALRELCGPGRPYVNPLLIKEKHEAESSAALDQFDNVEVLGSRSRDGTRDKLVQDIEQE